MNLIGENIRKYRKEKKLTQKKLGELCHPQIAESTIRRYELGKLNPTFETLEKIGDALQVHPLLLTGEITERQAKTLEEYTEGEETNTMMDLIKSVYNYFQFKEIQVQNLHSNYYLLGDDYITEPIAITEEDFYQISKEVIYSLIRSVAKYSGTESEKQEEIILKLEKRLNILNSLNTQYRADTAPDQGAPAPDEPPSSNQEEPDKN